MKFQTERCMICNTPKRPTNIELEYIGLAKDGCVYFSEFWVCSVECFEQAIEEYLDREYSFKYRSPGATEFAPKVKRGMEKLVDEYAKKHPYLEENTEYCQSIVEQMRQEQWDVYNQWEVERLLAVNRAREKLGERVRAEDKLRSEKILEDFNKNHQKEREAEEGKWARDEEETRRIHERQRKEREQQRKEQEKIDEQRRREQERIEQLQERPIPEEQRFSGTWICSPQGRGKTTLLLSMLQEDILRDDNPAIIIIDGKGDIINLITDLEYLSHGRCIILDPQNSIALNPLSIQNINIHKGIARIEYIFSALLDAKITPKQQSLFRSVIHALILGFQNPTITTFRDIISNGVGKYREQIAKLPTDLQEFFAKEFERDYDSTRQELKWRLRLLDHQPFFKNIFNAPCSKVNLEKECDEGKIIVVNNNQDLFGAEAAEFFGCFFLAQIWNVSTSRSRRTGYKRPIYVYVDEAQMVIRRDEMVANIIDECRSQKIAMIFSHQRCEQIKEPNVLSALSNCAIRISNADEESKIMADKLHTDVDHMLSLKRGQFAVYVRDLVRHAFTMNVIPADWSGWERLGKQKRELINAYMDRTYGYGSSGNEDAGQPQPSVQIPTVKKITEKKDPSTPAPWGKA